MSFFNQFVAIGEETSYGVAVTRPHAIRTMGGTDLEAVKDRKRSKVIGFRDPQRFINGAARGEGTLNLPLQYDSRLLLILMKHAFGVVATTGSGPYTHNFTLGSGAPFTGGEVTSPVALTVEGHYGFPDTNLESRRMVGGRINRLGLSITPGEEFVAEVGLIGQTVAHVQKTASPTFPDLNTYQMLATQVTVTIDAGSIGGNITGLSLELNNDLQTRASFGSGFITAPYGKERSCTGSFTMEYSATTSPTTKALLDKFESGATASLTVQFGLDSNYSLQLHMDDFVIQTTKGEMQEGEVMPVEFTFQSIHDPALTAMNAVWKNQTSQS